MRLLDRIDHALTAFARLTTPDDAGRNGRGGAYFLPLGRDGVHLTHDQALRLSAVWACVNVISKSLAASRWEVFLEKLNGDRELQRNTTTYRLLNVRPNPEMTAFGFHEASLILALIGGNSYSEIEKDSGNRPIALWPISPERCTLDRNGQGERVVRVTNFGQADTLLPYNDVFHIHGPSVDGLCGMDVVAMASRTIAHGLATERFGQAFYDNGTQMGGVIEAPQTMTDPQVQDLREQIDKRHRGAGRAFHNLILTGGAKWNASSVEPDKAQFNETSYRIVEEVCRWYGVPPHKVGHLLRSTFSNIEHQGLEFVRDALTPWAERLVQEADYKLLPAQGRFKVRMDIDWLAEGDAMSKANTDAILVRNGLARRNEIRRKRGLNSLGTEGETLTVESQLTTLKAVAEGANVPAVAAPNRPREIRPPTEEAARSLYASALKRSFIRYHHRVTEASAHALNQGDFRQRLASIHSAHVLFMREQIDEVHSALQSVGVNIDTASVNQSLRQAVAEDLDLVTQARQSGSIETWCHPEDRADQVAAELADAALGTHQNV